LKFIEFGIGNKWLVRTETEIDDGTEYEVKGIVRPITIHSFYIRVWIGKAVFILDSKEGIKKKKKNSRAVKFLFGIKSL
jgi:Protein of unknown function (DUF3977)